MSEFPKATTHARASHQRGLWRRVFAARLRLSPPPPAPKWPVELEPFTRLLDPALLEAAARRAEWLGVGGDEVLRAAGILTPEQITTGIAAHLGLAVDPLGADFDVRSIDAATAGVVRRGPLKGKRIYTLAARGLGLRRFIEQVRKEPETGRRFRLAVPERFTARVRETAAADLARQTVYGLRERWPEFSASKVSIRTLRWTLAGMLAATVAAFALTNDAFVIAAHYFFAFTFIAWTLLRLLACLFEPVTTPPVDIPEASLPVYSIIVPLKGEARVVPKLMAALGALQYPPEKLDVKIMIEADDAETRAAVEETRLRAPFEIIAPPQEGPQTKPRALTTALPFVRGQFVTIYDAEDEPEPDQLLKALSAFARGPQELACVQAKLFLFNGDEGWFARQFTAEYAGQFDVLLPALAKWKLPLPLGGTSNHFRTSILREAGGWDPYNVTEDADLGMRLARFGYATGVVDSTTWEEAPVRFDQWLKQRTRWLKGWMQTYLVHMRSPLRLWREMGWRGFLALQLLVGGSVLSALVHPIFMLMVAHDMATGEFFTAGESAEEAVRRWLAVGVLATGYLGSIALGFAGLKRRGLARTAWILVTVPAYWLLLSLAAWRALVHLLRDPYQWEKTEHGVTRAVRTLPHRQQRPSATVRPIREFLASRRRASRSN